MFRDGLFSVMSSCSGTCFGSRNAAQIKPREKCDTIFGALIDVVPSLPSLRTIVSSLTNSRSFLCQHGKSKQQKTIQFKDGCTATCFYCPQWGHMQVAQRVDGHILPAIDGQEANWMRDVELLLICVRSGGLLKSVYTPF